jgi:hypothetical protein
MIDELLYDEILLARLFTFCTVACMMTAVPDNQTLLHYTYLTTNQTTNQIQKESVNHRQWQHHLKQRSHHQ